MYATPDQLRELLGEGFAAVEDAVLIDYLSAAEEELKARLCLLLAELPADPPPLLARLTLYRAAAEVLTVYYGTSGSGADDGRQEFFTRNYSDLLGLIERDPALLGLLLTPGRGSACWFHEDPERPTHSRFRR